jgi:hypothetical protein
MVKVLHNGKPKSNVEVGFWEENRLYMPAHRMHFSKYVKTDQNGIAYIDSLPEEITEKIVIKVSVSRDRRRDNVVRFTVWGFKPEEKIRLSVTKVIGEDGGVIKLGTLTLTIDALEKPTKITVRRIPYYNKQTLSIRDVYEFDPCPIKFKYCLAELKMYFEDHDPDVDENRKHELEIFYTKEIPFYGRKMDSRLHTGQNNVKIESGLCALSAPVTIWYESEWDPYYNYSIWKQPKLKPKSLNRKD